MRRQMDCGEMRPGDCRSKPRLSGLTACSGLHVNGLFWAKLNESLGLITTDQQSKHITNNMSSVRCGSDTVTRRVRLGMQDAFANLQTVF